MDFALAAQKEVFRLRNKLLAHELADIWGCPHTGHGMAKYALDQGLIKGCGPHNRFYGNLDGTAIRGSLLSILVLRFPKLQRVLNNPLWLALHEGDLVFLEAVVETLRVGPSARFPGISSENMRRLCGVPSWERMGVLLLLLRTHSSRYFIHRVWLARNFTAYFALACLQSPFRHVALGAYLLVDRVLRPITIDGEGVMDWPSSVEEFQRYVDHLTLLADRLLTNGWAKQMDDRGVLLLWMALLSDKYVSYLCAHTQHVRGDRMPAALRMALNREVVYLKEAGLSLGGLESVKFSKPRQPRGAGLVDLPSDGRS
ncbi:hypothetical protein [Pseudomonas sp. C9-3]|uniref:hypothetical protein n=1 Tax=Pseudomonas sp. C9-3 TaxID=3078264 RepID=UPI0028E9DB90|nr:hypothetical protein [Pseudomonas sp. C9-3]